jgi:hypothetical protein
MKGAPSGRNGQSALCGDNGRIRTAVGISDVHISSCNIDSLPYNKTGSLIRLKSDTCQVIYGRQGEDRENGVSGPRLGTILPLDVHQFREHLISGGDDSRTGLISPLGRDHVNEFLGYIRIGDLQGVGTDFTQAG